MHTRFSILFAMIVSCCLLCSAAVRAELPTPEEEAKATAARDEEMLRKAGLSTETKDLIAWLKARSEDDADLGRIDELIQQLGSKDKKKREAAQHKLVMLGLNGWMQLIKAAKSEDANTKAGAKACMGEIEKEHHAFLNLATVRLLVHRRAPEAVEILLRYLPFTVDENVEEEIYYGLDALRLKDGKLDPFLLAALKDGVAARRAVAGCIIGRVGSKEQKAIVRKLLGDKDSLVRLRSAQGLLAGKDKAAVPALIGLLTHRSPSVAWQAEELLRYLAASASPDETIGKNVGDKAQSCEAAWLKWWKDRETECDLDEPASQGRSPMLLVVGTGALYVGQGGLGDVSLCGSSSTPTLLSDGWNIRRPWHAEWLKSDLLLLGEEDKVCTRTTTGEIEWQVKASTIGVSPDTPDPVCQHRYPFRVYYSLNAQHQDVRAIQRERGTGTAEDSNFWEFGLDGTRELLPCEKQQKIGGHDVAKRLEDGNWLSVARYGEAAEIDGRTGAVGRSFLFNGIQRSCVVTMLPLPYGDFLVANNHELSVKQITLNGKEVWSYSPLKTDPLGVLRISARLRNGNTLLQTQGHRITEVTPDGREVWEAFVDKDFVVCCSRCLSLVSFGFPSRPKKLNVGDLDHLREGLKSASPMRRQHCRNVVFKMGDKGLEALPEILGNLLVDEPNCAQEFLKDHPDEAAKSLIPWIDASDARKRSVAIGVLGGLGCEPQGAFPKILARLKDRDGEVRLRAINAVSSFKSQAKSAVPALLELATNDQNELNMRCAAIESIGDFGDAARPAIPALLRLADVEDLEIRRAAIKSLGCSRISEKRVVDALAHALEREDTYQMKRTVCHAIKNHGPDASGAVPALIKVCGLCDLPKTDDLDLQALLEDAADALGAMSSKASDAVPALLKIALNRDLPSRTRAAATEAICGTGKAAKPYAAALRSALTNTDDEIVRRRLADLLDNLSRDE